LLKPEASWAAKIEMAGARTVTNNADPLLDGFVHRLAAIWKECGGQITHGEDGPLIRFLSAVTAPTLAWVGKKPLTIDKLRGVFGVCGWRAERQNKSQLTIILQAAPLLPFTAKRWL